MNEVGKLPDIEQEVYIDAPSERVYALLTTGDGWDAWFTDGTTVEPRRGGSITLRWKNFGAGRWTAEDGGPVVEADRNRKFSFEGSPGSNPTTVCITLKKLGSGTLVRLTESGYSANGEDLKICIGCAVGWGEALTLLKTYLEHGICYGEVPRK